MRTITRRLASGLAVAVLGAGLATGAAAADPVNAPHAQQVAVDCGEAGSFQVVTNGNGAFTPAHDLSSNKVLIPVSFGTSTFTVRDAEGNVVFEGAEAGQTKGHARVPKGRTALECTYTLTFPVEEGNTATVTGTVTGFISGRSGRSSRS
jgi:hypothetical protein